MRKSLTWTFQANTYINKERNRYKIFKTKNNNRVKNKRKKNNY